MLINYKELFSEVEKLISSKRWMVLATSKENRVTARSMSVVNFGLKIYFQTDTDFVKYEQMAYNSNVALCIDNIQIEGMAKFLGHPFSAENTEIINKYKVIHKRSFEAYSHLEKNIIVEVEPKLVTLWKYYDGKPYLEMLDIEQQAATRKKYVVY